MIAMSGFTRRPAEGRIGPAFHGPALVVLTVLVAAAPRAALGQPFTLSRTFDDSTPTTIDNFGASVALDGSHVLIGAHLDDTNGFDVGQVHLFIPEPATLCLLALGGVVVLRRR